MGKVKTKQLKLLTIRQWLHMETGNNSKIKVVFHPHLDLELHHPDFTPLQPSPLPSTFSQITVVIFFLMVRPLTPFILAERQGAGLIVDLVCLTACVQAWDTVCHKQLIIQKICFNKA